jgi:hypothetical protein
MAKRSSNSNKTELIKTITPIGQEVPKGGIPIDSKSIENMDLAGSQRAVTGKKNQVFHKVHKEGGFEPKIGPKQAYEKVEPSLPPNIKIEVPTKKFEGGK